MIKSMTGFGRGEAADEKHRITVEMKSVNHRYLDMNIKMPKKLNLFEAAMRSLLKTYIQRGKVDIYVTYEDLSDSSMLVRYNGQIAGEYYRYLNLMAEEFHLENDVRVSTLSRYPEIFTMEEEAPNEDEIWPLLQDAIKGACGQFIEAREREGENLKKDMVGKLDEMYANVLAVEARSPEIVKEYREKIMEKAAEVLGDVQMDESRIAAEVVLFADKICTDEETVRLKSHILTTKETLDMEGSIGRKLDFIAQEMNREANTILSKANDLEVTNIAIALKTDIEKIREQIQNIE
ncbi:MAG TPA: YicC family protein [Candidatus Eubacterium avistercoris]|uniref:YicC family protein n=1 Tax=Candidatus Eubacterium avistercoris TaxID=2838567 RepID=A0A9D2IGX1_9FIRM|nr:YicC family protein [Candidatus Eubacterium avistercoris]